MAEQRRTEDWGEINVNVRHRNTGTGVDEQVHVAFTIDIHPDMTEQEIMEAATAAMRRVGMDEIEVIDSEDCECCQINDYDGEPYSDEPWCKNCNHSPEEHEQIKIYGS